MDSKQLRHLITEILEDIDLYSAASVELLMGTAAVETNLGHYIEQRNGPALGIFQLEPNTIEDIYINYLNYKPFLYNKIKKYLLFSNSHSLKIKEIKFNLAAQIVLTRLCYLRVPERLPRLSYIYFDNKPKQLTYQSIKDLALYWKKYYNTYKGKGTVKEFIIKYKTYCM